MRWTHSFLRFRTTLVGVGSASLLHFFPAHSGIGADLPLPSHRPPAEAAAAMTVPAGFQVTLFASEPEVTQPIAMTFDDRGRLWVAENCSYPTVVPTGSPGATNRLLILEDADHDGQADRTTTMASNLGFVTGLEYGFRGLWLGSPPQLLFLPRSNNWDRVSGAPIVMLDGFGSEDPHETLSNFTWGPDGWLYGLHGHLSHSLVGIPGTPAAKRVRLDHGGVWRFHPTRQQFEIVTTGGINPWGIDFDAQGQMLVGASVIPHLYHGIPGARYQDDKGREPFLDEMPTIADHRHWEAKDWTASRQATDKNTQAGGGHAHAGLLVYQGDNFPPTYRQRVLQNNLFGNCINQDALEIAGSSYRAKHRGNLLQANDTWFRGIALQTGPDGGVYVLDWHDPNECHNFKEVERASGRIYKITYRTPELPLNRDLARLQNADLVTLQTYPNDWYARHARRVMQERRENPTTHVELILMLRETKETPLRLRALWALNAIGGFTEKVALTLFSDRDELVRAWAVRLCADEDEPGVLTLAQLNRLATEDPSPAVRLALAGMVSRLKPENRWSILEKLSRHAEDASDPALPRMYYYAAEGLWPTDSARVLKIAAQTPLPLLRQLIAKYAATK